MVEHSIEALAEEILALSKKVARILKNLPDGQPASSRYAMYM